MSFFKSCRSFVAGIVLSLISASAGWADYTAPHFFELVGGADLIVLGQVESIQNATYRLKIERTLSGRWESPTVNVMKVNDWACSWRHAPYSIGDRVVVFLKRSDSSSQRLGMTVFAQMSAGCEGELPVVGSAVYCYSVPGFPESRGTIGRHSNVYEAKLDDLISAIEGYRSLYRVTFHKNVTSSQRVANRVGPSPEVLKISKETYLRRMKEYARRSDVHKYLVESTEAAISTSEGKLPLVLPTEEAREKKAELGQIIIRYRGANEAKDQ